MYYRIKRWVRNFKSKKRRIYELEKKVGTLPSSFYWTLVPSFKKTEPQDLNLQQQTQSLRYDVAVLREQMDALMKHLQITDRVVKSQDAHRVMESTAPFEVHKEKEQWQL